jgi:hypothetical protein
MARETPPPRGKRRTTSGQGHIPIVTPQTRVVVTMTQYPFVKTPIALVFDKRVPPEALRLWQIFYALKYEGREPITVGAVCDALWHKTQRSEANYRDGQTKKRDEGPATPRTFERHRKVLQDTGWLTCRRSGDELYVTLHTEQAATPPDPTAIAQQLGELLHDGNPKALARALLATLAEQAPEALHQALQDVFPPPPTPDHDPEPPRKNTLHSGDEGMIPLSPGVIRLSSGHAPGMTNGSAGMTNGSTPVIRSSSAMTNGSTNHAPSMFMKNGDHEREKDSPTTGAQVGRNGGGGGGNPLTSERFLRDKGFSPQARKRHQGHNLAALARSYHELGAQGCGNGAMVNYWDEDPPEVDHYDEHAVAGAPDDFTAEMIATLASFLRDGQPLLDAIGETRRWTRPGARTAQEDALAGRQRSRGTRGPIVEWDELAPRRSTAKRGAADCRRQAEQLAPEDFSPEMVGVLARYLTDGTPLEEAIESVYIWAEQQEEPSRRTSVA